MKKLTDKEKGSIVLLVIFVVVLYWIYFALPSESTIPEQDTQSNAYKLALLDIGDSPSPSTIAAHKTALNELKPLCAEDETTLSAEISNARNDLLKNGIAESNLSIMQHLRDSVPAKYAPTECKGIVAAYLILRESK